jgi:thiol-disulfide isomerase/thioredoxin
MKSLSKIKEYILNIFVITLITIPAFSQNDSIIINGCFVSKKSQYSQVGLVKENSYGGKPIQISSVRGKLPMQRFHFSLPANAVKGVYSVSLAGPFNAIQDPEILIDGTEREISFTYVPDLSGLIFIKGKRSKEFQEYKNTSDSLLKRMVFIQNQYKKDKSDANLKLIYQLQKEYNELANSFCLAHKGLIEVKLVRNRLQQFADIRLDSLQQQQYLFQHYWDNKDTNDPELLETSIYNEFINGYLKQFYLINTDKTPEMISDKLIQVADTILAHFNGNSKTYDFAVKYLEMAFNDIGQFKALQYIDTFYGPMSEQCSDDEGEVDTNLKETYRHRIEGYKATAKGMPAPNITYSDNMGNDYKLNDLKGEQTLIIFWETGCSFCDQQMPKVEEYVKSHPQLAVLAVCINPQNDDINRKQKQCPHFYYAIDSFYKGESAPSQRYYVTGTPTYFLLNKNKKFIGTYYSWDAAKNAIQDD